MNQINFFTLSCSLNQTHVFSTLCYGNQTSIEKILSHYNDDLVISNFIRGGTIVELNSNPAMIKYRHSSMNLKPVLRSIPHEPSVVHFNERDLDQYIRNKQAKRNYAFVNHSWYAGDSNTPVREWKLLIQFDQVTI